MNFMRDKPNKEVTEQAAPFELRQGEKLELRIFIDRSILEVFANGRQCITQRIYPTRKDSLGVELFSKGGSITVESIKAWDMAATNPW
jgi:beta-fructofuranosidase